MSLWLVLAIVFVCVAAPLAAAERAIAVEINDTAPFDANELRRALAVRLPPAGARVDLRVAVATDGVIHVSTGDRVREVDVTGLHGEAAARLVALAASDLLLDDLAPVPAPPRSTQRSLTLAALGAVSTWPRALAGGAVDVTLASGSKLVSFEVGGATLVDADLRLTAITSRVAAGLRLHEVVELRAGITLVPLFVADGTGDRTVLFGGHATARLRLPLWPRVHAVFAAGADVLATRTEYRVGGMTVLATPRFAPSLGLGVEVTP